MYRIMLQWISAAQTLGCDCRVCPMRMMYCSTPAVHIPGCWCKPLWQRRVALHLGKAGDCAAEPILPHAMPYTAFSKTYFAAACEDCGCARPGAVALASHTQQPTTAAWDMYGLPHTTPKCLCLTLTCRQPVCRISPSACAGRGSAWTRRCCAGLTHAAASAALCGGPVCTQQQHRLLDPA